MTYDNSLVIKAPSVQVKSWHSGQNTAGTYPGFYNMKHLGVLLLSVEGMTFRQVYLTVCRHPFKLLGGERHCESKVSQEHNTMTQPGLQPGVQRANRVSQQWIRIKFDNTHISSFWSFKKDKFKNASQSG